MKLRTVLETVTTTEQDKEKMSIGALQLKASLKRMALEKRRNLRITCCEFFSHLILLVILVLGYNLSEVANFPAKTYTDVTIRIPPAGFTDTNLVNLTAIDSLGILRSVEELLEGPLKVPNLDQFLLLSELVSSQVDTQFGDLLGQTAFGRVYTNLLFYGDLHLAPSGPLVDDFVSYMRSNYQRFDTLNLYIHASEDEAVAFILDSPGSALALIVFRQISPEKVNYVIRQNYTTLPNTNSVVNPFTIGLNTEYQNYYVSGFLSIQKAVDEWVFNRYNEQAGSSSKQCGSPPNPTIAPFPTAAYDQNPFYLQVGFLLGLAMVMSTLYPMSRLTKSIVEEKELKLREIMKIMGLRDWVHQLSWFISAFILFFWISVSSVFVTGSSFLVNSDPILLFAFYFLFTMSEIMFSFLVSVFFSNSKLAAIVAPVLLFIGIVPRFVFLDTNANERVNEKIACSLLSPTAFTFGADLIANYEYTGVGIQFSNINDGRFSFAVILSMLFVDFWLYAFLAWYLDQVVPHEYGTARHLLFFLDWRYWFGDCYDWLRAADTRDPTHVALVDSMPEFTNNSLDEEAITASTVEALPAECKAFAAVCIDGLRKRYSDGKLAVKNLSMCMLEGQITCLLGHNGAGKSTTISTLIGMIEMTSGNVSIYGKSLRRELSAIRRLIGVCPQQNVLFPTLTVSEHLKFFGNLKGWGGSRLQQNIDEVRYTCYSLLYLHVCRAVFYLILLPCN